MSNKLLALFCIVLKAGFSTARQAKIQSLRDTIKLPGLEFVEIDDVATADFTEVLKGNEFNPWMCWICPYLPIRGLRRHSPRLTPSSTR